MNPKDLTNEQGKEELASLRASLSSKSSRIEVANDVVHIAKLVQNAGIDSGHFEYVLTFACRVAGLTP